MPRTIRSLACAVAMVATAVPALADPFPPPLATAVTNLSAATSFHVVALAHGRAESFVVSVVTQRPAARPERRPVLS